MGNITPHYQPGQNLTGKVTSAAVVGGRVVMPAAPWAAHQALPVN